MFWNRMNPAGIRNRWLPLCVILFLLLTSLFPQGKVSAQTATPTRSAEQILSAMTPEERVGQLFLVTFQGLDYSESTNIYKLITQYHVGGVILRADNNNFTGPDNTVQEAYSLTSGLQQLEWLSSKDSGAETETNYIPLLIGIAQEGDSAPYDQILNGLTTLPNEMAIGATWDADLARQVGEVMGAELEALGFNLLLGPSLDVLDVVSYETGEDLGTRTFGGDPYWVGIMGSAYIQGLHDGSSNRLAVIAKHFPGRGGSDRPTEQEVATVRKSLEQLKQIELAPFFAVTGFSSIPEATTDGLLVSHIRYQGFQGNIRATTKPVSFDQAALEQILALPAFSSWRASGGIVVSDDLGSQAVRKFFDPNGQSFDARQVARSALLAGNDLLYVNNLVSTGDPDSYTTLTRTLEFFAQRYREDANFADRVNQSVLRILNLKLKQYPEFQIDQVIPAESGLEDVGQSQSITYEVARKAGTLINPTASEVSTLLSPLPTSSDRIVFLTDTMTYQQCSACTMQVDLPVDGLQNAVLRLYGLQAGGSISRNSVSSYTFSTLAQFNTDPNSAPELADALRGANWVVVSILNADPNRPDSLAFKQFLDNWYEFARDKKLVVFAFNAPYYLDSTDISKITAYYSMYGKSSAFIDMAARILFQEMTPLGALPVNVAGVGYELIVAMSPSPNQVIPLMLDLAGQEPEATQTATTTLTPEPTAVPTYKVGDVIPLRTGVIVDHNNNPVPDGTVVRFIFTVGGDVLTAQTVEATTVDGIARTGYRIASSGVLEIRAASDPATVSDVLRLDASAEEPAVVVAIPPTPQPTLTAAPTDTPEAQEETNTVNDPDALRKPGLSDWVLSVILIWLCGAGIYFFSGWRFSLRWGIRMGLGSVAGGLLGYCYMAFGLPNNQPVYGAEGTLTVIAASLIGVLIGWGITLIWFRYPDIQKYFSKESNSSNGSK